MFRNKIIMYFAVKMKDSEFLSITHRVSHHICNIFISTWINDKILIFFRKMRREKFYENCIIKFPLNNPDGFPHTQDEQLI
jgi:hypothetical protein